jgi:hypothetical protein
MNDVSSTVEIKGSPAKLIGLLFGGILMTALCGMIVIGYIPVIAGSLRQFLSWVGLVFFAACTFLIASRLLRASSTVVTLSPEGILDTRVAERPIPWNAIQDVGVWTMQGQKVIVLPVPPETESALGLTRIARWSRQANKKLGADGLCVMASGLKISHDALLAQITARIAHTRGSSEGAELGKGGQ